MQYIYLTGVVDDGTKRQPRVPHNTAMTIQFPRLSDVTVEVTLVNNAGVAIDLATDASWNSWFTVVRIPKSCEQSAGKYDYQLASTTIKAQTRGTIVFVIPATAFRRLQAGRYFYDVVARFNSTKYQAVRISGLHLEPSLRRA